MNYDREYADSVAESPPLVVDRQRIVHSAAFRRLQYKTQVFVALEADHFRTRLTHTLEVTHLARVLAEPLGLSPELAEVVALAHDLGHPPFGHAGEVALNECLAGSGGFEHNAHALRVVEYLEHPYPDFRGLNLTRVVRSCLAKHTTRYDRPGPHPLQDGTAPPLEGQVAALSDWLTYILHDLQDGLTAGLIEPEHLEAVELWRSHFDVPAGGRWRGRVRPAMDRMQAAVIRDAVAETGRRIAARRPSTSAPGAAPAATAAPTVALSEVVRSRVEALEAVVVARVYRDPRVRRMDSKARRIVRAVFEAYAAEPQLLPRRYAERVTEQGAERVAADYIAGMTDRFCLNEHARLFDPRMEP